MPKDDMHDARAGTARDPAAGSNASPSKLPSVGWLWSAILTVSSTLVATWASPRLGLAGVLIIYLLGVVIIALRFNIAVAVFSAVTNVLVFDFIFIPPPFCFSMPDLTSAVTCGGMLIVAAVVSGLTRRMKAAEAEARAREMRTSVLYALSRELADATNVHELAAVASRHFEKLTGFPVAILVRDDKNALMQPVGSLALGGSELAAVRASWTGGVRGLAAVGHAPTLWLLPMMGAHSPEGLVVFRLEHAPLFTTDEERELAEVCAQQTAMAFERTELAARARGALLSAETERARSALLSSLSHDFRTPLAAIVGAGNSLVEFGNRLDSVERTELAHGIVEEGERLHRLLTNVLALTRLEGAGPKVQRTPYALEEVVDSAVRRLGTRIDSRQIIVDAPFDAPMASLEPMLTEQLLINVLENALRYSPNGSPIDVKVRWTDSEVSVSIADRGPGVPPEDESRIFEKFYRSANADRRDGGMGLGLAICRAIAQAQDGRIEARNRSGGGLEVSFSVPKADEPAATNDLAPISDANAEETSQC